MTNLNATVLCVYFTGTTSEVGNPVPEYRKPEFSNIGRFESDVYIVIGTHNIAAFNTTVIILKSLWCATGYKLSFLSHVSTVILRDISGTAYIFKALHWIRVQ